MKIMVHRAFEWNTLRIVMRVATTIIGENITVCPFDYTAFVVSGKVGYP